MLISLDTITRETTQLRVSVSSTDPASVDSLSITDDVTDPSVIRGDTELKADLDPGTILR
jgi:hypothetical protein